MYSDFMLVGPTGLGCHDVVAAIRRIGETGVPLVSRGDRSGTHLTELALWKLAGLDPAATKPA